jgi:hypothetical protein
MGKQGKTSQSHGSRDNSNRPCIANAKLGFGFTWGICSARKAGLAHFPQGDAICWQTDTSTNWTGIVSVYYWKEVGESSSNILNQI